MLYKNAGDFLCKTEDFLHFAFLMPLLGETPQAKRHHFSVFPIF